MQLDLSREDFRAQKSKWQMKLAEVEKQRNQLQGKDTGYMAQLRKKEMEVKKLQDQLQKVLAGKSEKKAGLSLVVALPRGSGGRQRLSETEEFLQRAGDAYTEQLVSVAVAPCPGAVQATRVCCMRVPTGSWAR